MGLKAVEAKLGWLQHHFQTFDEAVSMYVNRQNIHFRPKRYNDVKTMAWGSFESTIQGEGLAIISHMFGDVLQTANSSLDYLVCELFLQSNPEEEAKLSHKFPIVYNRGAFNQAIGGDALYGIPFEAVAVIEGLQPYHGGADSMQARLAALRTLTNTHKHRKLHVSALTACPAPSDPADVFEKDGELFVLAKNMPKAQHFKAELGPFAVVKDGKVDVDNKFSPVVVLEERFQGGTNQHARGKALKQ